MYIFNALVIILISTFYSSLTEKLSIPAMFKTVLIFFIALIFGIKLLIFADFRAYAMPIAFPLLHTLFVMFTNMLPNNFRALYGQYLDVLQSKRLVPIILTGGRYGGIVGGLSIPLLIPVLGSVSNLLYVWIRSRGRQYRSGAIRRMAAQRPPDRRCGPQKAQDEEDGLKGRQSRAHADEQIRLRVRAVQLHRGDSQELSGFPVQPRLPRSLSRPRATRLVS